MKAFRRGLAVTAVSLMTLGLAACGSGGGGDAGAGGCNDAELKFAFEGPTGTAQEIAANMFADELDSQTDGGLKIQQFPGAQLGGEPELLEKVRAGAIDFIISSTANATTIAPVGGVFSEHYLASDRDQAKEIFSDDTVNEDYISSANKQVKGAQALTLFMLPMRNMYADFPIHSVDDIKGKKVRIQATSTDDTTFAAYGAQTVHMSFTELYSALQTGVVDMAENALTYYGLNKHYEVAPVMSFTEHSMNGQVLWVSDKAWKSLCGEQQDAVKAAAMKVRTDQPAKALELEDELREKYKDMGVKYVTDVDKESFKKISQPLQDQITKKIGPDAVKLLADIRKVTGD
jgi:tripartite ATP-independent transporter DctP family solute receptor